MIRSAKTFIEVYCVPELCTRAVSSNRLDVAEVSGKNSVLQLLVICFLPGSCSRAVPDLHTVFLRELPYVGLLRHRGFKSCRL